MKLNPRTLLIDLDGTLVGMKSLSAYSTFVRGLLRHWKGELPLWTALRAMRAVDEELRKPHRTQLNLERAVATFARATRIEPERAGLVLQQALDTVFPKMADSFYPVPGASDFIAWARPRFSLVLATNPVWARSLVELRVKWAGLSPDVFDFITDATNMSVCKPHLGYYRQVLDHRGIGAEDCLMIGNEPEMDLPAAGLGIPVYLISPGKRLKQLSPLAWRGDYADLQKMLSGEPQRRQK